VFLLLAGPGLIGAVLVSSPFALVTVLGLVGGWAVFRLRSSASRLLAAFALAMVAASAGSAWLTAGQASSDCGAGWFILATATGVLVLAAAAIDVVLLFTFLRDRRRSSPS